MTEVPSPGRRVGAVSSTRLRTQEQARQLCAAARGTSVDALVVVALSTGMRQGALLGLRWRNVDLEAGVLSVRQALTFDRITRQYRFKEPKNKRSRRQIQLPPPTIQALRGHQTRQAEQRGMLGPAWIDNDLVFPNPIGGPSAASTSHHAVRKLLVKATLLGLCLMSAGYFVPVAPT